MLEEKKTKEEEVIFEEEQPKPHNYERVSKDKQPIIINVDTIKDDDYKFLD